jgi:DNA repair protein RecO (recombination protein O)
MEWQDRGIIIGTRRHGETSLILEVMTEQRGRHLGLVRGGRSRKQQPVLQPGNEVELTWRARLEDHLGTYSGRAGGAGRGPADGTAVRHLRHPASRQPFAPAARA